MNKKILTSIIVLSGLLFGGNVFAAVNDYIQIKGEGFCEMQLPADALKDNRQFEFKYDNPEAIFDEESGKYLGLDNLLKEIRYVLPDAVIKSYKYDSNEGVILFNLDTKLQKDMLGIIGVQYNDNTDVFKNLSDSFFLSKEYFDCRDTATKSAMKNAMESAKILKSKIVSDMNGSLEIHKTESGKLMLLYKVNYKAVAE